MIGCGAWGRNHVRTLVALGALRAVHDADPAAQGDAAQAGGVPASGLAQILGDPAIAGIVIATPDATHAEIAARALEAGKHVLVEKPLAMSVEDGRKLASLAREANLTLMAGHILLYHPGFLGLCDIARAGRLGEVRHISSKRHHIARGAPRHALWDLGPHDVSMVLELAGCLPAAVRTFATAPIEGAPPQQVNILLSFADGLSADISLSAVHPVKLHQITLAGTEAYGVFEDSLGWEEKLMIIRPGLEEPEAGAGSAKREPVALVAAEPLRLEIEAFLAAIAGGPAPASGAEEALDVVRVLAAAAESLKSGRMVTLDRTGHDNIET